MEEGRSISNSAGTHSRREAYMDYITENFSDELLQIHEVDGSLEVVEHLKNCIENGIKVWDYPLQVPLPQ